MEISTICNGVFVLNFVNFEQKMRALEQAPWSVANKMLFLKLWSPDFDMQKEGYETITIRERFPNLKLHYYTEAGLSKIASILGKPLYTDNTTVTKSKVAFARVCVEVGMDNSRPSHIQFINEYRKLEVQAVEYEWIPPSCNLCSRFGHDLNHCPQQKVDLKEWRPKKVLVKANEDELIPAVKHARQVEETEKRDIVAMEEVTSASSSREQSRIKADGCKERGLKEPCIVDKEKYLKGVQSIMVDHDEFRVAKVGKGAKTEGHKRSPKVDGGVSTSYSCSLLAMEQQNK